MSVCIKRYIATIFSLNNICSDKIEFPAKFTRCRVCILHVRFFMEPIKTSHGITSGSINVLFHQQQQQTTVVLRNINMLIIGKFSINVQLCIQDITFNLMQIGMC